MATKKEAPADVTVAAAIIEQAVVAEPVTEVAPVPPKSDAPIDTLAPYKERKTVDHKCFVISGPTQRL